MHPRLAVAALCAIPVMAVLFHLLTRSEPSPLAGYLSALGIYWLLLALALLASRGPWSLRPRWPGCWALAGFLAILAALVWQGGLRDLMSLSPVVLLTVVAAAMLNGTLEEAFWRGALIPGLTRRDLRAEAPPLALFVAWHAAPGFGAVALAGQGGMAGLLLAALILGLPAMAARLHSGSAGAGAIGHVLVNLLAFAMLAARNPASGLP